MNITIKNSTLLGELIKLSGTYYKMSLSSNLSFLDIAIHFGRLTH